MAFSKAVIKADIISAIDAAFIDKDPVTARDAWADAVADAIASAIVDAITATTVVTVLVSPSGPVTGTITLTPPTP